MKKFIFKTLSITLSLFIMITIFVGRFHIGAVSYVYDTWKNIIPSTEGITYKETYYGKDIKMVSDPDVSIGKFSSVADMKVYDSKIYIIDSNLEATTITLQGKDNSINNISKLYILNQNFQCETVVNEFLITDEVKQKLDDFYHFDTPLDEITITQFNSTEYINIYDAAKDSGVVSGGKLTLNVKYDSSVKTSVFELKCDDKVISKDKYTTALSGDTTVVTLDASYNGKEVIGVLKTLNTPGRAPYIPYSLDNTKAAVRLSGAQGLTVTKDYIYIADTINARVLKLNHEFVVVDVYLTPNDNVFYQMTHSGYDTEFGEAYETIKVTTNMYKTMTSGDLFQPKKVAVTPSGVLYAISANVYEGLVEFGTDTEFNRFLGKNTVTADPLKTFLSNFFTDAQLAKFALSLPPMFNNITVSSDGFLYATSDPDSNSAANMVKIINTKGVDIMKRNGYVKPDGDAVYLRTSTDNKAILNSSVLTAVAVNRIGNFTVSDRTRGRLFTYDSEGNLLYITGEQPGGTSTSGSGNGLSNSIVSPVAVDYLYRTYEDLSGNTIEEETVIVLDNSSSSIILYETTEFGQAVNTATYLYQNGIITDTYKTNTDGGYILDESGNKIVEEMGAESYWRQVIKMNTNYELAYLGIGKALLRRNQNKDAMYYFKLAHNPTYYSKAYANYRDEVLNANFSLLMTVVLVVVATIIVGTVTKKYITRVKTGRKEEDE